MLLLDLGNSRLKAAWLPAGAMLHPDAVVAFPHAADDLEPSLGAWLQCAVPGDAAGWLAAVAPDAAIARVQRVLDAHGVAIRRATTQSQALGLRVAYADPSRLGVDRWLAMLGARARGDSPALIVGVGSALTVDAVDAHGQHLGGLIAPPPEAMRAALIARAPRLAVADGQVHRFATTTEDAVASGCVLSAAALIERSWNELATHSGVAPRLLLSGGGAAELAPWLPPHDATPHLVIEGLARWAAQA